MPIMIAPTAMQKMAHPDGKHIYHDYSQIQILFLISGIIHSYSNLNSYYNVFICNVGEYATARAASAAGTIMVRN